MPLPPAARAVLARRLISITGNAPVFSTDSVSPLRLERVSEWVTEISQVMVEERESREAFQLRDLRRTLETLLASLGVNRDVRGQVQSHGLGGVQNRHYDRHEYWDEKRAALTLLEAHLARLRSAQAPGPQTAPAAVSTPSPVWAILPALALTP